MDMQETKPTHSSSDEHQTDFDDEEEMILAGIDEDDAKVSHGSSTPLKTSSTSVEQSFNMPSNIVVPMTSLSSTTSQSPSYVDVYSASTVNHNGQVYNSSMGMYAMGTNPLVYSSSISSIANMYPNTAATSAGLSAQGIASLANPAAQALSGQYPYSYAMPYSAAYVDAQGRYYFTPQTGTHASYPYATVQVPYQSSRTTAAAVTSTTEFTSPPISSESPSLMASSKAPRTTTITSKPKRKKDPSAPKNPLSAYLFFVTEQRAKLAGKSSKGFADLARDLGQQWKEMTDDEKSPYQEMAKRDKERFQFEKKAYERRRKNSNGPSSPKEDSAADLPFAEPV